MKKLLLLSCSCFILNFAFAQKAYYEGPDRTERKVSAHQHVKDLRKGILLVRLASESKKIEALLESGRKKEAVKVKAELDARNKEIVSAINSKYEFSRFYYFYAQDASEILKGNYETLMDTVLQPSPMTALEGPVYFLATDKAELTNYNSSVIGFTVYDKEMNILMKPFPYTITKNVGSKMFEKTYEEMVVLWQAKLLRLEARAVGKRLGKKEAYKKAGGV